MEHQHSMHCVHCRLGCDHPHDETDPVGVTLPPSPFIPALPLSVDVASDDWRKTRCTRCGTLARTPMDALPLLATPDGRLPRQDREGYYLVTCGRCVARFLVEHRLAMQASRN